MTIEEISSREDELAWEEFVTRNQDAGFAHQLGWRRLVEKLFGYKPIYLMAKDDGDIKGVLPLFLVSNLFFGKRLISLPFATLGGACSDSGAVNSMLVARAIELTRDLDCDYLELRNLREEDCRQLIKYGSYFTFRLNLNPDPEELWRSIRSTNRTYIRRAEKTDLQVILYSKDFERFYEVYSLGQRNLGTPIQSYRWLKDLFFDFPENHYIAIAEYRGNTVATFFVRYYLGTPIQSYRWLKDLFFDFPENHYIAIAEYRGNTVATFFVRYYKNAVSYVFGYALEEYRHLYPNYVVLWKLIQDACRREYKWFVLGRSVKSSGTYFFKEGWRATPIELSYQRYLNKSKHIPDTSQESPRRQIFAKMWGNLPLTVANRLGPFIRKCFP
jgi:hypothetical protein